ncbi:MAG TPA: YggS family pyridoxal phosphate-dependent enzyme [Thermodesulfovibrionales bacterium]|nr:YggS family pyridoxal phosphate-dependent enzyme [Thermodesulfovibrionales bacterium]
MGNDTVFERINTIYKQISHAALKVDRNPMDITLIAVTKTVSLEGIREAIDAGLRSFGENRVQEAREKVEHFSHVPEKIEWHMIGSLQRNKAKYAVQIFDIIHAVDSMGLARDIDDHAGRIGKIQDVLIEVKLSPEESKHGTPKDGLMGLIREVTMLKNLNLRGLMTIPPLFENSEGSRAYFRELRNLRDEAAMKGFHLPELSMGMSHDFKTAIEEGATMVRIGTAIFGTRK